MFNYRKTICMIKISHIILLLLTLVSHPLLAADNWFEETMYSSGKIYVVVAVVLVILLGIFAYMVWFDRRLRKLEDEQLQADDE